MRCLQVYNYAIARLPKTQRHFSIFPFFSNRSKHKIISWKNEMKIFIFLSTIRTWHQDTGKENFSNISSPFLALFSFLLLLYLLLVFFFGRFLLLNVTFHSLAVPTTIPIIPASHKLSAHRTKKKD